MLNKEEQENIPQQESDKNIQIEKHNSQMLSQNNFLNKTSTPDSNKINQCYTQRENISNIMGKMIRDNQNNYNYNQNLNANYIPQNQSKYYIKNNMNPIYEYQLKQLKLNYIALNNDNIIYREDINKLMEINKKLEKELANERNHNYELAKENDKLNSDNLNLFKKIDDVNKKITQIKIISQNEKDIMDKQIFFEEKMNEKDFECKKILEDNNKLNLEYKLLNDKYDKLKNQHNEDEKELNLLKNIQEEKINEIEKKLGMLINEMNKLKNENKDLKTQNENYRNNIIKNDREKNDYINKYQQQKLKNDMIKKEIQDIQLKYKEFKKNLEKKEEIRIMKENMRKNKSENKIKAIQDLQKRIQEYKTERAKNQSDE